MLLHLAGGTSTRNSGHRAQYLYQKFLLPTEGPRYQEQQKHLGGDNLEKETNVMEKHLPGCFPLNAMP